MPLSFINIVCYATDSLLTETIFGKEREEEECKGNGARQD